jgi:hypothetical protein
MIFVANQDTKFSASVVGGTQPKIEEHKKPATTGDTEMIDTSSK